MNPVYRLIALFLLTSPDEVHAADAPFSIVGDLVRSETWTERWPDSSGLIENRAVTAEVWTAAFQAELDRTGSLHIPAREQPYYLDGPVVLVGVLAESPKFGSGTRWIVEDTKEDQRIGRDGLAEVISFQPQS